MVDDVYGYGYAYTYSSAFSLDIEHKHKKNKNFCSDCVHDAYAFVVDVLTTVMRGKVCVVEPLNLYGEISVILLSLIEILEVPLMYALSKL